VYDCVCMYYFVELTCVNCVTSHSHGSWPKISWALQPPCNVNVLQPVHGRDLTPARGTWHFSDLTESVRICIYHIHIIDIMPYDEMMSIAENIRKFKQTFLHARILMAFHGTWLPWLCHGSAMVHHGSRLASH